MNHLSVPMSFWTCAPTVADSRQAYAAQYLGHVFLRSLNFSQWAFQDPHLHLLSEVPLMLCTFICCSFLWFVCGLVVHVKDFESTILSGWYGGAVLTQCCFFRELTNLDIFLSACYIHGRPRCRQFSVMKSARLPFRM